MYEYFVLRDSIFKGEDEEFLVSHENDSPVFKSTKTDVSHLVVLPC